MNKNVSWVLRSALAIVYIWFGGLKLLGMSPATPLVHHLFDVTVPLLDFTTFFYLFATFEVLIGISFLFPKFIKISFAAVVLHLVTTVMPLFLLPDEVWTGVLTPTLEGQYIIKNVLIFACAYALFKQPRLAKKRI